MIWTQSVGEFLVSFWWLPASLLTLGAWTTTLLLWCLYSSQFRVKWGCLFSKSPYFCLSSYPQGTGRTVLPHCVWTSCLHKSPQRPPSVWLAQPLARRLQDPSFVTQWPSLSSRLPSVLICAPPGRTNKQFLCYFVPLASSHCLHLFNSNMLVNVSLFMSWHYLYGMMILAHSTLTRVGFLPSPALQLLWFL